MLIVIVEDAKGQRLFIKTNRTLSWWCTGHWRYKLVGFIRKLAESDTSSLQKEADHAQDIPCEAR
jgi:hypothetical protein